jgi:hypothetical protein
MNTTIEQKIGGNNNESPHLLLNMDQFIALVNLAASLSPGHW